MVAQTESAEPVRVVVEQAAGWYAQLTDENCSDANREAFAAWLNTDPTHRIAFDRMAAIADRTSPQDPVARVALRKLMVRRPRNASILVMLALASLSGTVFMGRLAADDPRIRARIANDRTAIGELRTTRLQTGDSITLDSDSAADVGEPDRSVTLWRGGMMAKVQTGLPTPFVVHTRNGTARALGTQFSVRVAGGHTIVAVIDSRVEVCAASAEQSCLTLSAGQSARLDTSGSHRIPDNDPQVEAAWSEGLLVADDRPLASVLLDLNRYRSDPIQFSAAELDGLRVTGTFPLTDTDRALSSIGSALPVTVEPGVTGPLVRRLSK
jgi:transmembrane sensor